MWFGEVCRWKMVNLRHWTLAGSTCPVRFSLRYAAPEVTYTFSHTLSLSLCRCVMYAQPCIIENNNNAAFEEDSAQLCQPCLCAPVCAAMRLGKLQECTA